MRRLFRPLTAIVLTMLMPALPGAAQQPAVQVSGDMLTGDWEGRWSSGPFSDRISLTVKAVEGDQVKGTRYIMGRANYHNRDLPVIGTIKGDMVSVEAKPFIFLELKFEPPKTLKRIGRADRTADIELQKIK